MALNNKQHEINFDVSVRFRQLVVTVKNYRQDVAIPRFLACHESA